MKALGLVAATVVCAGCPSSPQHPRPAVDDTPSRVHVAQLEVKRQGGVAELAELALHGDVETRRLALRGLGRIGGARAIVVIEGALTDDDRAVATAAAAALGIAGALETMPKDRVAVLSRAVSDALPRIDARVGYEALGRFGDASVQPALGFGLKTPAAAEAALALGRHGRRKLPLIETARGALIMASQASDAALRYAATYALSREVFESEESPDDTERELRGKEVAALALRIADAEPETRAVAIYGLAKRKAVASGRVAIEGALRDPDWRVAVEAVRALAGDSGDARGAAAVAASIENRLAKLAEHPTDAHVVIEGQRLLAKRGTQSGAPLPFVNRVLAAADALEASEQIPALTRGWIECLATLASERGEPNPNVNAVATCGHGNLPDHLRLPLLADFVDDKTDPSTRRAVLRILLAHSDARVRAAGIGALAASWQAADAVEQQASFASFAAAISAKDPIVAGAAADAAPIVYEHATDAQKRTLAELIVGRARSEADVELSGALYELIGKLAIGDGADACRNGVGGHPVRAKAALECLRALGEPAAQPPDVVAPAPPVDVADVIGKKLRWHLETTGGPIDIALRPDIAPWNVATLVALTKKGFYDGLEFHRVVPNFVVQGGDPTMSGWGGPGFTTPAEPASLDDLTFAAGGVGIADSGPDSGGSQWFVMHSRAPHLEGRYTEVGAVVSGNPADALQIGDRVLKATIAPM